MENDITNLKVSMGKITENLKWIRKSQEEMKQTMEDFIGSSDKRFTDFSKEADKKYAPRWVVKMIAIIATIAGTAILGGILNLIIK